MFYADGEKRYIIAPHGLKVGQEINSGKKATPEVGNAMYLSDIPFGTIIHNIELRLGKGGQIVRSAGAFAQLMAKEAPYALVKLPSGVLTEGVPFSDVPVERSLTVYLSAVDR